MKDTGSAPSEMQATGIIVWGLWIIKRSSYWLCGIARRATLNNLHAGSTPASVPEAIALKAVIQADLRAFFFPGGAFLADWETLKNMNQNDITPFALRHFPVK
ncbi:hypothetical protein [Syntrophobotulus glycolicus]|uniref:hypothetical protein n=1 Tax=Syntrophobotulus glycolicus TaxID=51197 RepID=UPI00059DF64D|nr:hypothetical protein [Syntrophobotulus glycolicus]